MSESKTTVDHLISKIKQERDELKLKIHLASMEANEEYQRLSDKCDRLTREYEPVQHAVSESAKNVRTALGMVAEELSIGLDRIRNAIIDPR